MNNLDPGVATLISQMLFPGLAYAQAEQIQVQVVDIVRAAVIAERQACAADVCLFCDEGEKIVMGPNGAYHRRLDGWGWPYPISCRAAPIHERAQAQAQKESDHA